MEKTLAYVGVDYHAKNIMISVYLSQEKRFIETLRLPNNDTQIIRFMQKLSRQYELKICYEASGSGYVFQRKMRAQGWHCDVIAPSLVPKKAGDRRKNDYRDARRLAEHYANNLLTVVHPPTQGQESVRTLIRCRFAFKDDVKRVKKQINSLLLSQGHFWQRSKWTHHHRIWLRSLKFSTEHVQLVFQEHLAHLDYLESRLAYLNSEIEQIAATEIYAASVQKLRCLRGIDTLTAMVLVAEITDFRRFASPRALMAFLGLIPSEQSSDERRKGGGITKAGNYRCRTLLVESAQHYSRKPCVSYQMKHKLAQADARTNTVVINCMHRLHKRYWHLHLKGKIRQQAIVAVARELVGFVWDLMREPVELQAAA